MSRTKKYSETHIKFFKTTLQGAFVRRLSLKMFFLKKFCDLAKNFLCNFDPHAYHYVFISIVKSKAFAGLIQNEGMNVKIPTTKDEFKLPFIAKTPVCFTQLPASTVITLRFTIRIDHMIA